jgi:hypothetical protein
MQTIYHEFQIILEIACRFIHDIKDIIGFKIDIERGKEFHYNLKKCVLILVKLEHDLNEEKIGLNMVSFVSFCPFGFRWRSFLFCFVLPHWIASLESVSVCVQKYSR